jgi:hypothetical protein
VFCNEGRVVDEKAGWGMKMGTIWSIRAHIRDLGYEVPDEVWKTSAGCYYQPDREPYLPYPES